jgi:pimeloyl-ACP methyl ester carboxylesterase
LVEFPDLPRLPYPAIGAMKFVARELSATVRVGLAAPRGWGLRSHPAVENGHPAEDVVVLVHGLMATAGAFSPVVRHLREELELDVRTFSFLPGASLDRIATMIGRAIGAHPHACRIHLVGHSLGGLASRWYVQEHDHDPRVVQTISIASPFRGVDLADLFPARLRALAFPLHGQLERIVERAPSHVRRVPHVSIVAERDQLVTPVSGILPGSPSFVLHDTGHNGALFHPKLFDAITQEITRRIPDDELGG